MFGPAEGRRPGDRQRPEEQMTARSGRTGSVAGRPVAVAGARAAGRAGCGLLALGGRRESGAAVIAEHTRLAADIAAAGPDHHREGRFDEQSLHGKVVSALAAAAPRGIRCWCWPGRSRSARPRCRDAGIAAVLLADYAGSVALAIDDAANQLAGLAAGPPPNSADSGIAARQGTVEPYPMGAPPRT